MDQTWWKSPNELDENQRAVIDLSVEGNHLVIGPPGCGKTNLLMLRASFLYQQGKRNIAIVTFNRTLKEFLGSGTTNIKLSNDKVKTLFKWSYDLLQEHDIKPEKLDGFEEQRNQNAVHLQELLASNSDIPKYDCLLLDEVQDYTPEEIEMFSEFSDQIFAVGDSDQSIYEGGDRLTKIQEVCGAPTALRFHYRNGRSISRFADSIKGCLDSQNGLEATCLYDEVSAPSSVQEFVFPTLEEQTNEMLKTLRLQLRAYPEERIGIACPKNEDIMEIWKQLSETDVGSSCQLQLQKQGYSSFDPSRRICLMTVNGTKGLEFRALHIAAANTFSKFRGRQKRLAYTAVTRAKTSLNLYHNGKIPNYLERAFSAISEIKAQPSLDDLFRG